MKLLLIGASGFIGQALARRLEAAGHDVLRAMRRPREAGSVAVDLSRMTQPDCWLPLLQGIDGVVNAAGILRETRARRFDTIHDAAPRALFAACEAAGVTRVIQISALGADAGAASRFHLSKKSADDFLAGLELEWVIVQPSLVFGPEGASAQLFALLAALPVVPLPGDGAQRVQPIHIDDLVELLVRALEEPGAARQRIAAVGPRAVTLREWLETLRVQLGLAPGRVLPVPLALVRAAIGRETLDMLLRGNVADAADTRRLLGREPRDIAQFVAGTEGRFLSMRARLAWLLPLLRATVALTWLASGIVSLGLYPVADSLQLLARVGLHGAAASVALYGAAVLDILLGAGVYVFRGRWLWRVQLALILAYTVVLTFAIPELWLHPFGPLVKNIPMAAAIALLHEFEERG